MTFRQTLGLDIFRQTPIAFVDYIRSLYIRPISKTSTVVEGINISWGKKKIIRIDRSPKYVTRFEIAQLAKQYDVTENEMWLQFRKRKIQIRKYSL